jgi:hypothetical protein
VSDTSASSQRFCTNRTLREGTEFAEFVAGVTDIERESADTDIRERVVALFSVADYDLPTVVPFLLGRVFPAL